MMRSRPLSQYSDLAADLNNLTGEIVDCFYHVHRELGPGYTENIYEDACVKEFEYRGIAFERQKTVNVLYKGVALPSIFKPDLIVENQVLLELKAVEKIHPVHQSQIYAYLKATNLPVGFLVNFNTPLIKNGIGRYINKNSASPDLRVKNNGQNDE